MMGGEGSRYVPQSWGCFVKIKHEHFPPWELAGPKCSASLCLPVLLLSRLPAAIVQKRDWIPFPCFWKWLLHMLGGWLFVVTEGFPFFLTFG